jgi:hypothetical protein
MRLFMSFRQTETPTIAAAKAGFSTATAYRIEQDRRLASQKKAPRGRRRHDPLAAVWESEVVPLLKSAPGLRPVAIFDEIRRRHPEIGVGIRRTLERRIRSWRALNGAERDVIFRQEHSPGQLGLSDFTEMSDHGISIAGVPLDHRLYHFRLPSRAGNMLMSWSAVRASWHWPRGCRMRYGRWAGPRRSIAATVSRLPSAILTTTRGRIRPGATRRCARITACCRPATIGAWRTRTGRSKARMAIWSERSRTRCCCAGRDFETLEAYRRFVDEIVGRRNARNSKRLDLERPALQALPANRTTDYEETIVTVASTSGFTLKKVFYSVPSRLIGHRLRARLYDDRLDCFLGATALMTLRRGRPHPNGKHGHVIDYRHVIHALRRKPMALLNLVYREQLFPRRAYQHAFEALLAGDSEKQACRTMVGLLALAHDRACEAELAEGFALRCRMIS